jgi:hypothetical protein
MLSYFHVGVKRCVVTNRNIWLIYYGENIIKWGMPSSLCLIRCFYCYLNACILHIKNTTQ